MIDEILNKISPEEALEILRCLAKKDSDIARKIEKEALKLLKTIDLEEICEEVFQFYMELMFMNYGIDRDRELMGILHQMKWQ